MTAVNWIPTSRQCNWRPDCDGFNVPGMPVNRATVSPDGAHSYVTRPLFTED